MILQVVADREVLDYGNLEYNKKKNVKIYNRPLSYIETTKTFFKIINSENYSCNKGMGIPQNLAFWYSNLTICIPNPTI